MPYFLCSSCQVRVYLANAYVREMVCPLCALPLASRKESPWRRGAAPEHLRSVRVDDDGAPRMRASQSSSPESH